VISEKIVREINRQIFEEGGSDKEMISLFRQMNLPVMTLLGDQIKRAIETQAPARMCKKDIAQEGFALLKTKTRFSIFSLRAN
jgi:hypothetical protein